MDALALEPISEAPSLEPSSLTFERQLPLLIAVMTTHGNAVAQRASSVGSVFAGLETGAIFRRSSHALAKSGAPPIRGIRLHSRRAGIVGKF